MTTISVVIPCYNDVVMLRNCLAALAQQLRPADEIIVVDNGSTDDTAAVAVAAGARLVTQPVRGIWPASAAGFDAATGDLIARLDADSVPPTDWLAHIEAEFTTDTGMTLLTGPGEFYDCGPIRAFVGRELYIGGMFASVSVYLGYPPVFGSNFAMRREVWQRARDRVHILPDIHDDLDFSMNLHPAETVRYDDTLVVGISARPLQHWRPFGRRLRLVGTTVRTNWPASSPRRIRRERAAWRSGQDDGVVLL
jgi:glycosyltransferase involved in cell wall biosynthesis